MIFGWFVTKNSKALATKNPMKQVISTTVLNVRLSDAPKA